jgi:hypothetical protein
MTLRSPKGSVLRRIGAAAVAESSARRKRQEQLHILERSRSRFVLKRSLDLEEQGLRPGRAWGRACEEWDLEHEEAAA